MPDKRKKKTREDAIELLKQRAANNGLKNQAQQGANFEKANRPRQSVSTSQSANSSTTPRNTTQSTMRGSQSPSAVNSLFKETARKATGRGASGNTLADRRQRYSQQRDKSTTKTPTVTRRNSRGQETTNINRTRSLSNASSMNNLKRDTGRWARNEAYGALTGLNADLASTVDFLLPDVITPKAVQRGIDYYKNANETQQKKVQALRGNSRTREIVGNIGVNAIQQIPTATMAMLSGGTSLAAEAAPTLLNPSTLTHTGNVVTRALGQVAKDTGRNPMFWETFLRTAGNTYDNEIRNGASPTRATLSAYANGLLNAQIEVGGGVEVYDPSETFLKAIARSAKEEGLEEVQQYAVENLVNKAIGSNNAKWFSMNRGDNAVVNPVDMLEQGAYGAIGGGLASGGRVAMAKAMADVVDTRYANAHPDIQGHAQNLIRQAQVQGRTGERMSNSERLANAMQDQMSQGVQVSARQVRELESALRVDQTYNAQDYERRSREQYQQAVSEGRADRVKQQGTLEERQAANSKLDETIRRNYERAKSVMGENASEQSVKAVANVMTGSTDNADIDTVLMDTEAKKAVEKLSDVKLSANNQSARNEIENLALTHQIENRDTILKEAQETVRTERNNMSKRGGALFDENYDHAMEVLNVPNRANIYESFFSRFYTDGTVKGANFDDSYNRIMSNVREDFGDELAGRIGEVFNLDFAQKVFTQGQMAQAAYNAKYQGKTFALKASENPAGFTYEDSARTKISDKQADLLKKFAERANVHIRLVDSIAGGMANGSYEDGVIMIAADTSNKLVTVAKHELTHHIRSTSPELYQKLEDFIFNKYYEWDADALENKIREYQARGYKMTAEKIKEEIVADASESFFTDKGSIQAVVDHDRGLAQAIHDGIKTLLDTLLDLQESDNLSRRGYGDFLDDIGILREAEKMWLDALNDTVEKSREARPSADDYTDANAFDPTDYKFSLVEDKDEIRRLNAEPSQKAYRAMALIDGKLYPPMSTKVKGKDGKWKLNTGLDIGQWIESDITTDHTMFNKEGKFILKKDNGDTIYAAYNPYIHSSDTMLNDQFSTAYKRPNIVVVEGDIPTSELSNGYRAEHDLDNGTHITAKDTTGVIEWKAGIVQGKLTGTRTVYLTQHFKPVRVVPDSEVAKHIQDMVKGTDVVIPYNVVTPNLREELLKLGVDMAQSEDKKYQVDLNTKFSLKTDEEALPKNGKIPKSMEKWAKNIGLDTLTKQDIKAPVNVSVRSLRSYWYVMNGRNDEARAVNQSLKSVGDALQTLAGKYKYIGLDDAISASVHYRTDEKGRPTSVYLTCQVKNAEYEINYDFTTICAKRAPLQKVLERFIKTEGERMDTLYDELKLDEEGMYKLRLILEQAGFEVSCIACFVEQNRYSQQAQAETVATDWNKALDEWASENGADVSEHFDLANIDLKSIPYEQIKKGFTEYYRLMREWKNAHPKDSANVSVKNRMLIEAIPYFRKRMNPSEYASIDGQRALMSMGNKKTNLYNLLKRGQGYAKQSVPFVAYNGEIALLPDRVKGKSLYNYLMSIGGARAQSASDFQIEYVYDYMQMVADLSARKLPMHMYTKVIELAELFGKTGIKINLSAMCAVDSSVDSEYAGLKKVNGRYVYNISDQSIDYNKAVKLQRQEGYSKNIGIIMVTLSKYHMLKALADKDVRYIIGYHSSKMPAVVSKASDMESATDYTKINKTNRLNDKGKALFDKAMSMAKGNTELERYKDALRIFDDMIQSEVSKSKDRPRRGNEYARYMVGYKGNTADFDVYNDIKTTKDPRKTADNYIQYCMDNDLIPMYFPFAFHENYYKCEVYDFNMFDNNSGEYAPMEAVQNIYPDLDMTKGETDTTKFMDRVSKYMKVQNAKNKALEPKYKEVEERAKNELRVDIDGNDHVDMDATGIDPSELKHRADMQEAETKHSLKEDTDAFFEARKEQELWNEKGKGYFDKATAFYSQYQEGQANKDNFFVETIAKFKQIARRPSREPDHVSLNSRAKVSSEYWYTKDGVIRGSNHWGTGIASCDWALEETNGRTIYGREGFEPTITGKVYGRANWSDFVHKTTIRDGELTSFKNQPEGKYQLKDLDSTPTIASQNTIAKLENQVKDLKTEFKRTDLKTADQKQVRIQAGKLLKRHDTNMAIQGELTEAFDKIFRLYKEKDTGAFDEAYDIAIKMADRVVDNMSYIREENAEADETIGAIKDYLRTHPIVVTEEMKRNITDYGDFRKRNFGRIKLKNGDKTNLDRYYYADLADFDPDFFSSDYDKPVDMLRHIEDVFDKYDSLYRNYELSSEEMQDYVVDIASDIMETAYNLQTKKTFADKKYLEKEAAVKKAREKALESRNKALERQKTRYEKQADALKEELWLANERTAAAKLRGEMDIQRLKQQQAESKEKARERKAESRERTKLLNIARRLDKLKTTAENRAQIDALIGDLDLVAKGMTDKSLNKLYELAQWYDDRAKNDPDFIPDSNIENKLKRLSKTHIKDMTIEEVRDLYDVLSNIENEIATEKKLIGSEVKKEIYEAGRETIKDINRSHGIAKSLRKLDTFFISGTLSPLRQIRRVTGYNDNDPLYIATKELADGQRKMLQYQMDSWKAFDRFMNDKDFINSLNGKSAEEIEVTGTKNGEPFKVKITPDIRMAMYLAGMNEDNLRHMKYGGITLPDIKLYKKGKISEAMESGETVKFSPSQIREIASHMSEREKEFAQEAYKYYNITSPQAINEVSEVLKGYSLARVNNYFPIHTDQNFLTKEFESMKFDGTIEGMGFLKERVKASNPILMTGLVDTLTKSIDMNSKYVGLAIPVRNFNKILGVKDTAWDEEGNMEYNGAVKESITQRWGGSTLKYIEKFMTDLQNGRKSTDEWGSVFSRARSRYAGAVLTLNASVAIKQAASYPTAAAVLGWAPLAKAMGNVGKVDLDLIAKYTPLQWYRSKGFSTTELGDITSSRTGNIPTPLNWIQGMDLLTTRKLWKASEYYVRQHNKSLKAGTDEYYKAVAEIYNKVIEETQPNYTTMQRPGLLRSDNEITLTLNMFKTQPYQNFNILFDAFGNFVAKRNQYKSSKSIESKKALKEANRDMQNAVTSQIAQLAVFAAMTSLWALFRRKDDKYKDEEGKLTIFSYMKKLGEDMISNLFADVPLGADIYSMASSVFTGDTYYGFTSVTDSAITDVMDSFKNGAVAVGDWIEYGRSDNPEKKPSSDMYKETENVISSASRAMGIPASNLRNLVNGIYGWVAVSADGEYIGTYEAQKMTFAKEKEMKQNLFRAYQNDKAAYEELRKMMIEDGFEEEKLDDYIEAQRKEHHTEAEQKTIDSTMQKLEDSKIWKDATEEEKKDFTNRVTNMALGITNTDTESITKYAVNGLTNEQVILYKLALKKADRQNDNNKSYNNDEKEAAIRMLEQNYKLTQAQKDALKGKKS